MRKHKKREEKEARKNMTPAQRVAENGKAAIVKVKMTGSRTKEFDRAFDNAKIPKSMRKAINELYT